MLFSLYTTFHRWDGLTPASTMEFMGWANYVKAFANDPVARRALVNKVFWTGEPSSSSSSWGSRWRWA